MVNVDLHMPELDGFEVLSQLAVDTSNVGRAIRPRDIPPVESPGIVTPSIGARGRVTAGVRRSLGGGISKIAPNGRPLSPMTLGYRGGGIDCPGFGIAISADDKVWATSLDGETISVFDRKTGKPLSPETGYNFGGQLGSMQGIITTPNGDVWALDYEKDQIVYLPKGDATKGRILGRTVNGKPVDGTLQVKGPFHLAVDQQDRIWVSNGGSDTVTRFPASDPGKAEQIKVGFIPRAIAIDSLGNAWVANALGHPDTRRSWRWSRRSSNRRPKASSKARRQRPTAPPRCGSTCMNLWPSIPAATFPW
jgi:DNA-binding beta-propeller fold protein YncE